MKFLLHDRGLLLYGNGSLGRRGGKTMLEITRYVEELKERLHLKSDYALAHKLGITQPKANHIRRGLKVPREELCIKMAKLLGKNPVDVMPLAQKNRAPVAAKNNWE